MHEVTAAIEDALQGPAKALVEAFFDPQRPFAGATFDTLPDNPPNRITAADLLAVTLLDMRFPPLAVRTLLDDQADTYNDLLAAIPDDTDLWGTVPEDLAPAYDLWAALRAKTPDGRRGPLRGLGPTTTSKLMARKRPRLVPIVDSVVKEALALEGDSWIAVSEALRHHDLHARIESLRPTGVGEPVSTLRLMDVLLWMRHSTGWAARSVRADLGLTH